MKILAVDDERIALDILRSALHGANYEDVTTVENARQALEAVEQTPVPFDCILLDIRMPGMDGIELCKTIRDTSGYDATPIIMITALKDQGALDAAMQAGATDYVSKPFNGLELGARLRAAAALSSLLKERRASLDGREGRAPSLPDTPVADLSDPLSLDAAPGTTTQIELHHGLVGLQPGVYAVEVFAFAITTFDKIYTTLSVSSYRHLLNQVALKAVEVLGAERASIAYSGNGCFEVALNTSPSSRTKPLERLLRDAIETIEVPGSESPTLTLEVVFAFPKRCGLWGGPAAALALGAACRDARIKALGAYSDARLDALREEFRRTDVADKERPWFLRPVDELEHAIRKIVPRRVRGTCGAFAET